MTQLTAEKVNPDVRLGQEVAIAALPLFEIAEANAVDPVHFWAGVIAAMTGFAVKAIGSEATQVLLDASASVGAQVHRESLHG